MQTKYANKGVAFPEIIQYKGFDIESAPYYIADSKGWALNIFIYRQKSTGVVSRNFYSEDIYESIDEAMRTGYLFGKKIIDNEVKNLSVKDMF